MLSILIDAISNYNCQLNLFMEFRLFLNPKLIFIIIFPTYSGLLRYCYGWERERGTQVKRLPPLPRFLSCPQENSSNKRQTHIVEMRQHLFIQLRKKLQVDSWLVRVSQVLGFGGYVPQLVSKFPLLLLLGNNVQLQSLSFSVSKGSLSQ